MHTMTPVVIEHLAYLITESMLPPSLRAREAVAGRDYSLDPEILIDAAFITGAAEMKEKLMSMRSLTNVSTAQEAATIAQDIFNVYCKRLPYNMSKVASVRYQVNKETERANNDETETPETTD